MLLSDGFDNRSRLELDDVVDFAKRVDSVVYCVRVPPLLPDVPEWMQRVRRRGFQATVHAIDVAVRGKAAIVTARRGYQRDWPK